MIENPTTTRIYLIRHATPDWGRTDIPYDIPPGPGLVELGEIEAAQLGEFIRQAGIKKLYHSPLERAKRTAQISAEIAGILIEEEVGLAEWRSGENEQQVATRFLSIWPRILSESETSGPIGLVTHGGPAGIMLLKLGLSEPTLETHRKLFDHRNPLPPAGVWLAEKLPGSEQWVLSLVFSPKGN